MRIYVLAFVTFLLSSCSPRLIPIPSPTQLPAIDVPEMAPTPNPQADKMISFATKDLSIRLSLNAEQIHVIAAEPIIWQDTALGCPRPGEVYTPQTIPGYQIRLEANAQEYIYHTDQNDRVILCIEDELPAFPVTPGEIDDGEPWMPVD